MIFVCSINQIISSETKISIPEFSTFQQNVRKNNKTVSLQSIDTIQQEINTLKEELERIQEHPDDFAFSCHELTTYHEKIYTLKQQISDYYTTNQTLLNRFRAEIAQHDQEERTAFQKFNPHGIQVAQHIEFLDTNFTQQLALYNQENSKFVQDHAVLQKNFDTFITTYQRTLEMILPITQSVTFKNRQKNAESFDALQPETQLHESSYKTFSSPSKIQSSFSTDTTRSRYFNAVTIDTTTGKLSYNQDFVYKTSNFEQKLAGIRALLINTQKLSGKNTTNSGNFGLEKCLSQDKVTACILVAQAFITTKDHVYTPSELKFKEDAIQSNLFGSWNWPILSAWNYPVLQYINSWQSKTSSQAVSLKEEEEEEEEKKTPAIETFISKLPETEDNK